MPDYEFYTAEYHGNQIDEGDYPRLSARAKSWLESRGCDLSGVPPSKLDFAICAIAEAWQVNEQGGDLASQTVGSWSKSFTQKKPKTDEQRLLEAAKLYLGSCVSVRWC